MNRLLDVVVIGFRKQAGVLDARDWKQEMNPLSLSGDSGANQRVGVLCRETPAANL
jgi:hypothetical protein